MSTAHGSEKDTTWWGDYVVISLVDAAASTVLTKQLHKAGGPGDALYSFEGFKKEFASVLSPNTGVVSDPDARILLRFLERDRRVVIVDSDKDVRALFSGLEPFSRLPLGYQIFGLRKICRRPRDYSCGPRHSSAEGSSAASTCTSCRVPTKDRRVASRSWSSRSQINPPTIVDAPRRLLLPCNRNTSP